MKQLLITIITLFFTGTLIAQKAKIEYLSNQPYDKYELLSDGDTLTFYLSVTSYKEDLPLIIYIQGSGMNSLFIEQNGKIIPTSGHITWFIEGQEKYRILIVEKPGIKYLQTGKSKNFDQKFSLENWSNTIIRAISYVTENEKIYKDKILIAGHSEGGVVASRVANLMKDKISNVAILAGNGATQLYSLYKLADNGTFFNTKEHKMPTSEQRINYLKDQWNNILAEPNNTEKKFWGFTYLRWSSFLRTSVMEELSGYNGKILLLQGTSDQAVYSETATIAYTTLLTKGKNIELQLIENADHSFNILDKPETDGWRLVIEKIMEWFNE